MSTFQTNAAISDNSKPDDSMHVNYTQGMVLGAGDFVQEFSYHAGRGRKGARDLTGYGTVCGLRVSAGVDARGPRVVVSSGSAVSPLGEWICVRSSQCAYLNDWLAANGDKLASLGLAPPTGNLQLFITLSYRECFRNPIPIPGEPCRTEDSQTAASRIADDFLLELRLTPPDQREHQLQREFVLWLRQVLQPTLGGPSHTPDQFADVIRQAVQPPPGMTSPPGMPPRIVIGSPPPVVLLPAQQIPEYLKIALRIWATEIRPRVHAIDIGLTGCCAGGDPAPPVDGGLLLAQIDLQVLSAGIGSKWTASGSSVVIGQARCPVLAQTSLLEEVLLSSWLQPGPASGGSGGSALPADSVVPEATFGLVASSGAAATYSRSDHTHGTPPITLHTSSTTAHNNHQVAGDVTGTLGASSVVAIRGVPAPVPAAANDGQALVYRDATKRWELTALAAAPAPGGDLTGTLSAAVVSGLQKFPVTAPTAANDGQVLTFRNAPAPHWEPAAVPAAAGGPFVRAAALPAGSTQYEIMAAGKMGTDGRARFTAYGGLRATGLPTAANKGQLGLSFTGYAQADRYVVKLTGEAADGSAVNATVVSFGSGDFLVAVTAAGAPVTEANRANFSVHIEISRY